MSKLSFYNIKIVRTNSFTIDLNATQICGLCRRQVKFFITENFSGGNPENQFDATNELAKNKTHGELSNSPRANGKDTRTSAVKGQTQTHVPPPKMQERMNTGCRIFEEENSALFKFCFCHSGILVTIVDEKTNDFRNLYGLYDQLASLIAQITVLKLQFCLPEETKAAHHIVTSS
ncbi:hypothetical protein WN51_04092 [Melipona quadrifasciata]|uniref:Uncharacterized protein n=1 Tax=Melipona quadrifasciata TaxID=166423 RepID=A0A0M8ZRQ3_9HYME|nr:hypothetical protein WN51_04092 [Melipona quadrifasciata]